MRSDLVHAPVAFALLLSPVVEAQTPLADRLLTNGRVYTVTDARPWAEAVAVRGDEIVFVGAAADAQGWVGEDTRVIDLEGRMVMPGLVESHLHLVAGGVAASGVVITDNSTVDAVLDQIRDYGDPHAERPGIFGWGWSDSLFGVAGPTKELLDRVVPDRPAVVVRGDGHAGWANTRALATVGVDRQTPDPAPGAGEFQRDADGQPTGYLNGGPANMYVIDRLPDAFTIDALEAAATPLLQEASALGITTLFDAGLPMAETSGFDYLQRLDRERALPLRYHASHYINAETMAAAAVARTVELRKRYSGRRLSVNTLKITVDGVVENRKAAYHQNYLDVPGRGALNFAEDTIERLALHAAREGLDLYLHTLGDRAVSVGLDAASAVRSAGFADTRITLSHVQGIRDEDLPRFRALDVTANSSGMWFAPSPADIAVLGEARYTRQFLVGSILASGARFANSSDYPAWPTIDPFAHLETSVTRARIGDPDGATRFLPPADERLHLRDAIAAYTIHGAHIVRMEDRIGTLEPGKLADLIVLDRNLFEIESSQIHGTQVLLTMVGGEVVHDRLLETSEPGAAR